MKMNQELRNVCEKIVESAKAKGAECDVILSKGNSINLSAQGGAIDKYSISGSQIVGVRVIKDQKVGLSYSESFDQGSLDTMLSQALSNSANSDVNEFEQITNLEGTHIHEDKNSLIESSMDEKVELTLKLESEVRARDKGVQAVPYNGFSEGRGESYYLNSNNCFGFESDSSMSCYTSALIKEGNESSMHYEGALGRDLSKLDIESCITESIDHARNWLGAKAIATGSYDVVFNINELKSLIGCFGSMFSAKSAWDKMNPFRDKMGQVISDTGLTLRDIPAHSLAFSHSFIDSEGTKRADLTLVENGKLVNFYHNHATANYFKTKSTGHGSRGAKGSLGVSGTHLSFDAGSESSPLNGEYLEVNSMQGLHSGASFVSGEFSFGASGYLCRDGKRVQPVKGITVAGNFYEMLKNIECIGDKVNSDTYQSFFSPVIRFSSLKVAGE